MREKCVRPLPLIGLCALLVCACGEDDSGSSGNLEQALAGTRSAEAQETTSAVTLPLGGAQPHHLRASGLFVLLPQPNHPARSIRLTRNIFRGPRGAFRIEDTRFWTDPLVAPDGRLDGREAVFDGEHLAVRRAWGPWMERDTVGRQHERLLLEAHDIAAAALDAFGPYLRFFDDPEGEVTLAGLPVKWERVSLETTVAPRPMEAEALSALREHTETWRSWLAATHPPKTISGRIARRVGGERELVAGKIVIEGTGTWGNQARPYRLEVNYEMGPLPPQVSMTLPADRLPPTRDRPITV